MAKQTYTKDERKAQFLKAGLELAKKEPLDKISVAAVAAKCKVTAPLVFHVFGNRDKFQAAIKREAKKQGVKLAEPKAAVVKKAPARKRSIAEVKAIKDKAAGKKPLSEHNKAFKNAGAAAKKRAAKKATKAVKKVPVAKKPRAAASGANASTSPRKQSSQKYPTNPVPQVTLPDEPKASL